MIGGRGGGGQGPSRLSVKSIDLIAWHVDRRQDHTHTHTHTRVCRGASGTLEVRGEIWPGGGRLCGSKRMCVCNIRLSRKGVAGSNRSPPESSPCWVISHSPGKSPRTHTHTHAHTHPRQSVPTYGPRVTGLLSNAETARRGRRVGGTPPPQPLPPRSEGVPGACGRPWAGRVRLIRPERVPAHRPFLLPGLR